MYVEVRFQMFEKKSGRAFTWTCSRFSRAARSSKTSCPPYLTHAHQCKDIASK